MAKQAKDKKNKKIKILGKYPNLYLPLFDKLLATIRALGFDSEGMMCNKIHDLPPPINHIELKVNYSSKDTLPPFYFDSIQIEIECGDEQNCRYLFTALVKALMNKYFIAHKLEVDIHEWWPDDNLWAVVIYTHPNAKVVRLGDNIYNAIPFELTPDLIKFLVKQFRSRKFNEVWKILIAEHKKILTSLPEELVKNIK